MNCEVSEVMMAAFAPMLERMAEMVADRAAAKLREEIEPPEPRYYTRQETASLLRITLPTLAALTNKGRINAKRVARRVLYSADEIDRLVASGERIKYKRA